MHANGKLKKLIVQIAHTDSREAYEKVFDHLFYPLKDFAFNILKSKELSEEIASDVLLMVWLQRKELTKVANIWYYAFVATKNRALNVLKKDKGLDSISLSDIDFDVELEKSDPETIFLQGEIAQKLEHAISTLPKQCRLVFRLVREEGFSYQETADMLSISTRTVNAHLVNATKRLVKIMKQEFKLT